MDLVPISQESEENPAIREVSPPTSTAAEAFIGPEEVEVNPGHPNPGKSSFTFSPSINLLLNQCSLAGLDWVEGLKNLSFSGLPFDGSVASKFNREWVPSALGGVTDEPCAALETVISPLMPDTSLLPEPDPGRGGEDLPTSPETSESGYFLRSSLKKKGGGLGKEQLSERKGRGRHSHLSKAQSRAMADLREGKQLSIERVLRAVNAWRSVRK